MSPSLQWSLMHRSLFFHLKRKINKPLGKSDRTYCVLSSCIQPTRPVIYVYNEQTNIHNSALSYWGTRAREQKGESALIGCHILRYRQCLFDDILWCVKKDSTKDVCTFWTWRKTRINFVEEGGSVRCGWDKQLGCHCIERLLIKEC